MMTLIAAALAAAQPATAPTSPQGQMPAMQHEQHEGMKKEECCCEKMGKGEHDMHDRDAHSKSGE